MEKPTTNGRYLLGDCTDEKERSIELPIKILNANTSEDEKLIIEFIKLFESRTIACKTNKRVSKNMNGWR
jgi:hypothetical protein